MWKKYLVLTLTLGLSLTCWADVSLEEDEEEEVVARIVIIK